MSYFLWDWLLNRFIGQYDVEIFENNIANIATFFNCLLFFAILFMVASIAFLFMHLVLMLLLTRNIVSGIVSTEYFAIELGEFSKLVSLLQLPFGMVENTIHNMYLQQIIFLSHHNRMAMQIATYKQ